MKTNTRSAALVLIAGAGLISMVAAVAQDRSATGDPARGKQLFYDHGCYGCHGYNGETGARDLVGTGSPLVENFDAFIVFLRARADFLPLFPSTRMPSFSEAALSDAAARDIFAYIRTFELDAPAVEDVPPLRAILESAAEH